MESSVVELGIEAACPPRKKINYLKQALTFQAKTPVPESYFTKSQAKSLKCRRF